MNNPILWIHGEAIGPANPALQAYPGRPAVFVFDTELLAGRTATSPEPVSLKRIGFLYECLLELPVSLRKGDVATEVLAFARAHGADGIVTSAGTDPRIAAICEVLEQELPVEVLKPQPFVELEGRVDLGRFSRYWRRAEREVWAAWSPQQ
ncbi:MAG: hypothetical protein ACO23X_10915 [Vulcanococcus sp.]